MYENFNPARLASIRPNSLFRNNDEIRKEATECEMKIAKVIPLFKNGNKSDFSNFYHSSRRYMKNYSTSDYNNS